ncbi:response regulator transcription factor [Hominenteromicrobium sp.]
MVNHKILIVEDDAAIAGAITRILDSWQMESRCVRDFRDVLREFTEYDPHLVLMDVTLPFFNGYHWCSEIRKISAVPVLFVSSAAENMNIVMAVDMGGDDFIAKPFDPAVLMAKIRALLRRTYDLGDRVPVIEHRGAVLNLNDGTLLCDGKKTELTRNEFRILQTLLESRGKVVSRETLMTRLWEYDLYVEENTLTVNMTRLRKKLAAAGLTDYITTRVGRGYLIE